MTDNLFDSIRDLLGDSVSPSTDTSPITNDGPRIFQHPFVEVDDTGCPKILGYLFAEFFDPKHLESIFDEGRIAIVQLRNMVSNISENEDISNMLPSFLLGEYDRSAPDAMMRWLARFTLCSGFLATVSLVKGETPSNDGSFADVFEYRIAFAANDVIQVARALASPIRADYAIKKLPFLNGGPSHD